MKAILGSIIGILGYIIIGYFAGIFIAVGVFLAIFGNNLERSNR